HRLKWERRNPVFFREERPVSGRKKGFFQRAHLFLSVNPVSDHDHNLNHYPDRPQRGTVAGPVPGFGPGAWPMRSSCLTPAIRELKDRGGNSESTESTGDSRSPLATIRPRLQNFGHFSPSLPFRDMLL